jgi:predicted nucleic acid-binding protein
LIYLDASALIKLAHIEPGSFDLSNWLAGRPEQDHFSSALIEVEVSRALRRYRPTALPEVPRILLRLSLIGIDAQVRAVAAAFSDPMLRSLDAIHLASALQLGDELEAFLSYDRRLLVAALAAGLPVESPGQPGPTQ